MPPSILRRWMLTPAMILAISMPVLAQPDGPLPSDHQVDKNLSTSQDFPPLPPHLRELDLNQIQESRIFSLMRAQAPGMQIRVKALRNVRNEMHKLVSSPAFDEKRAIELAQTEAEILAAHSLARAHLEYQVFNLLTPEQRQQYRHCPQYKMPVEERQAPPADLR